MLSDAPVTSVPPEPLAAVPPTSTATPLTVLLITLMSRMTLGTLMVTPFGTLAKLIDQARTLRGYASS